MRGSSSCVTDGELEMEIDAVVFMSESLHISMGFYKLLYLVY